LPLPLAADPLTAASKGVKISLYDAIAGHDDSKLTSLAGTIDSTVPRPRPCADLALDAPPSVLLDKWPRPSSALAPPRCGWPAKKSGKEAIDFVAARIVCEHAVVAHSLDDATSTCKDSSSTHATLGCATAYDDVVTTFPTG
jgi:hypothetical protein